MHENWLQAVLLYIEDAVPGLQIYDLQLTSSISRRFICFTGLILVGLIESSHETAPKTKAARRTRHPKRELSDG